MKFFLFLVLFVAGVIVVGVTRSDGAAIVLFIFTIACVFGVLLRLVGGRFGRKGHSQYVWDTSDSGHYGDSGGGGGDSGSGGDSSS